MRIKKLIFGGVFAIFVGLVLIVGVYAATNANVNINGMVSFEAIGNVKATVRLQHTASNAIAVSKNSTSVGTDGVLEITGKESSVTGDFFVGGSSNNNKVTLTAPEGTTGNVYYTYTITITNNYALTDQADKKDLKITFTPPQANANVSVNFVYGEWVSDGNNKTITIANMGMVKIKVTFKTNAANSNQADISSSLVLESLKDDNAQQAIQVWDGTTATQFSGGTGVENDPYLISNACELSLMSKIMNTADGSAYSGYDATTCRTAHFKLTNDIYLNDDEIIDEQGDLIEGSYFTWTPIGTFGGVFDGNKKEISGMYSNDKSDYAPDVALFRYINNGTTIKDLGLVNGYLSTAFYAGGVFAQCADDSKQISITNCYNGMTIKSKYGAGGIACYSEKSTIKECYNFGKIMSTGSYAAGIVAYMRDGGTIQDCYNRGDIINNGGSATAGIVTALGVFYNNLNRNYNLGNISSTLGSTGAIIGSVSYLQSQNVANNYYLKGCATDGDGVTQFGVGNATQGLATPDDDETKLKGLTYAQMRAANSEDADERTANILATKANYAGFDFETVWGVDPTINNGYPYLLALEYSYEKLS